MKYSVSMMVLANCVTVGIAGCGTPDSENSEQAGESVRGEDDNQANDSPESQVAQVSDQKGWAFYSSPEGDFSVMAPENLIVKVREAKVGMFREYVFRKGEAYFAVTIHTDRKEPLAGNSIEELKSDASDFLPGSLREISLGDMPGIEFRTQGEIGESIFREYCAPDNSRTISIQVAKDHEGGFSEDEIRLFLDSFKLLP